MSNHENEICNSFLEILKKHEIDGIPIDSTRSDIETLSNTSSYIGKGNPFIPVSFTKPENMYPVIQINFDSLSKYDLDFPKTGIFQLWCKKDFDYWVSKDFKGVYHPSTSIETRVSDVDWSKYNSFEYSTYINYEGVAELKFKIPKKYPIGIGRCKKVEKLRKIFIESNQEKIKKIFNDDLEYFDLVAFDKIYNYLEKSSGDHLIGPVYFAQDDPTNNNTIQIIQIDHIGDGGAFHVFINKDDLENCRFNKVYCSFDCY